jgi:NADPH:quinone reductase-like Zn-dependent oxidoreductase
MSIPTEMAAVLLTGHGGFDKLRYREDVPVPEPGAGEVLIRVAAAGINNTDINTRVGWYGVSSNVSTRDAVVTADARPATASTERGDWRGAGLQFPRIQGADVCGRIVAVGSNVPAERVGERIIVQGCLRSLAHGGQIPWLGSERDGGFAQFVCAPALDTYPIETALTDAELAAVPCAYGTAETLLHRAGVSAGESVLVTGASGNVGLAAVQLSMRRKASVIAVAAPSKHEVLRRLGADRCLTYDDPGQWPPPDTIDVVIDVVGGPRWPDLLDLLKPHGRYAVSGAIAGPLVELDLRKLYLKDLTFFGGTDQDAQIFPDVVGYVERGEIQPLVATRYPLREIVAAQEAFLSKEHVGKIVLVPPPTPA